MSSLRRIHLESGIWTYKVGVSYVIVHSPNRRRYRLDTIDIKGCTWEDLETGRREGGTHGMIKPKHVKKYIVGHLEANG